MAKFQNRLIRTRHYTGTLIQATILVPLNVAFVASCTAPTTADALPPCLIATPMECMHPVNEVLSADCCVHHGNGIAF